MTKPKKKKGGRPKSGEGGVPAWFDINKYRDAEIFSASDWYEQLCVRRILWFCVEGFVAIHNGKKRLTEFKIDTKLLNQALKIIRDSPLDNLAKLGNFKNGQFSLSPKHPIFLFNGAYALRGSYLDISGPVMRVNDIAGIGFPTNDFVEHINAKLEANRKELLKLRISPTKKNELDEQFSSQLMTRVEEGKILAFIDLSLPDKLLKKSFKDFLTHLKVNMKFDRKIKTFRKIDFSEWYIKGVLPYIDLQIWEKSGGKSVTDTSFEDEIHKLLREDNATSKNATEFIKTTKKYAKELISQEVLDILRTQAAIEKTGIRKKSSRFEAS